MNLKSKLFGFAAASVFALSMTTGAMAADSASQSVSVKLTPSNCSVTLTAASGSFGDWKWDGDNYEIASGSSTVSLTSVLTAGQPKDTGGLCPVTVKFDGLHGATGTIGLDRFSGTVMGSGSIPAAGQGLETGRSVGNQSGGTYTGSLTLNSVPNNYAPGTYNGTVSVTTGATQ